MAADDLKCTGCDHEKHPPGNCPKTISTAVTGEKKPITVPCPCAYQRPGRRP